MIYFSPVTVVYCIENRVYTTRIEFNIIIAI
jgi:hypothetical protein